MAGALTPGLHISSRTKIRRRRELAVKGVIHVSKGERVTADTVVAEAEREGELRIVRVAELLGVSPSEALSRVMVGTVERVQEGAVLA